jgi:hypothetical protein
MEAEEAQSRDSFSLLPLHDVLDVIVVVAGKRRCCGPHRKMITDQSYCLLFAVCSLLLLVSPKFLIYNVECLTIVCGACRDNNMTFWFFALLDLQHNNVFGVVESSVMSDVFRFGVDVRSYSMSRGFVDDGVKCDNGGAGTTGARHLYESKKYVRLGGPASFLQHACPARGDYVSAKSSRPSVQGNICFL